MENRQSIILWDLSANRLQAMEANARMAMKRLRIQADLQLNSEEPLLSRHHLIGRTPAVQVRGGSIWRCTPGQVISEEEFVHLFTMLIREKLL